MDGDLFNGTDGLPPATDELRKIPSVADLLIILMKMFFALSIGALDSSTYSPTYSPT